MQMTPLQEFYFPNQNSPLKTTHPTHMLGKNSLQMAQAPEGEESGSKFLSLIQSALAKVEQADVKAKKMTVQAIVDPSSIELHEVLIAAEKARFALNLTKNLSDMFIRTYRDLSNVR